MRRGTNPFKQWRNLIPKRARVTFDHSTLSTISLSESQTGNRLSIEYRTKRATLAPHISDANREWLYQTLKTHYRL